MILLKMFCEGPCRGWGWGGASAPTPTFYSKKKTCNKNIVRKQGKISIKKQKINCKSNSERLNFISDENLLFYVINIETIQLESFSVDNFDSFVFRMKKFLPHETFSPPED